MDSLAVSVGPGWLFHYISQLFLVQPDWRIFLSKILTSKALYRPGHLLQCVPEDCISTGAPPGLLIVHFFYEVVVHSCT